MSSTAICLTSSFAVAFGYGDRTGVAAPLVGIHYHHTRNQGCLVKTVASPMTGYFTRRSQHHLIHLRVLGLTTRSRRSILDRSNHFPRHLATRPSPHQ